MRGQPPRSSRGRSGELHTRSHAFGYFVSVVRSYERTELLILGGVAAFGGAIFGFPATLLFWWLYDRLGGPQYRGISPWPLLLPQLVIGPVLATIGARLVYVKRERATRRVGAALASALGINIFAAAAIAILMQPSPSPALYIPALFVEIGTYFVLMPILVSVVMHRA